MSLTLVQNTRYVVTEGARQKNEDWDAEANGNHVFGQSSPLPSHALTSYEQRRR